MNIKSLIGSARSLCGGSPPITLKADKSTDQPPMELFITDEHTEHYLSFKSGDESARGEITGMIFLMCTIPGLTVAALSIFSGNVDNIIFPLLIGGAILPISFIWECRAKLPLPVIFNRRTREVYFDHEGELFHTPWDEIEAITYEFMVIGPYVGGLNNAALEILVRRLGEPESALMVPLGAPMGKNLNMQKSFWEYIRSYMNNGPWFDEHGNNSPSKNFIQGQLSNDTKPSNLLTHQIKSTFKNKPANGKKTDINLTNITLLVGYFFLHPTHLIQDFIYDVAKRRARNRWPEIVLERLRPDGPTTRLIDLERERGLEV